MNSYLLLYLSMLLVSISQILLRYGATKYLKGLRVVVNPYVLSGYTLLLCSLYFNIMGLRDVPLKDMCFILPTSYVLVPLLSRWIFKEQLTRKYLLGITFIIIGASIFNLKIL